MCSTQWRSLLGLLLLLGECFVLFSDLVELGHVFEELRASLEGDEQLCLLAVTFVTCDGDGSGLDLLESGVVVSIAKGLVLGSESGDGNLT